MDQCPLATVTFRPRLENTRFFGIAGSVGKTTTKDLLVSILKVRGKTIGNPQSLNAAPEVAKTILRTRPWHRYCVAELGETAPGSLDNQLAVLQPSIGIITVVGDDHLAAFGSNSSRPFLRMERSRSTSMMSWSRVCVKMHAVRSSPMALEQAPICEPPILLRYGRIHCNSRRTSMENRSRSALSSSASNC